MSINPIPAYGQMIKNLFGYAPICLDEVDCDAYWQQKRKGKMGWVNSFQKFRAEWIASRIATGSTVLDIGCGDGGVLLHMLSKKQFVPIGADMSQFALEFLAGKGVKTIQYNINDYDAVNGLPEVDHVLLLEVLEHMQNPEKLLKLMETKARKSIFFSFPNTGYIRHRLRLLLGRFPNQWRIHPGEHIRFWTLRDLGWWLKELGYAPRTTVVTYEGIPLLNRLWRNLFAMGIIGEIAVER